MLLGTNVTAAALAATLAICSATFEAQLTPARLVSTSPSITETLFALGLGDRVVGVSNYCRFPPAVATLPKIGTFLKPDPELIARLRPDLVFVHSGPNSTAEHLAALGIKTARVETGSLSSVFSAIHDVGAAVRMPERAETLVTHIKARLDRLKSAVGNRPPQRLLIIVGRRTGTLTDIVAVGRGSYLSDIAAIAGAVNVLDTVTQYPRISMETIVSLAPDVIVDVGEMGESPADSDRRRAATERLWASQRLVKAVREQKVRVTTDDGFVVPGPRVVDIAERMAEWLHGVRVQ
jgi:iron complex transport system substrate-binding protein